MTTIQVPYTCGNCNARFQVTMKAGEPLVSMACPRCGTAAAPPFLDGES